MFWEWFSCKFWPPLLRIYLTKLRKYRSEIYFRKLPKKKSLIIYVYDVPIFISIMILLPIIFWETFQISYFRYLWLFAIQSFASIYVNMAAVFVISEVRWVHGSNHLAHDSPAETPSPITWESCKTITLTLTSGICGLRRPTTTKNAKILQKIILDSENN